MAAATGQVSNEGTGSWQQVTATSQVDESWLSRALRVRELITLLLLAIVVFGTAAIEPRYLAPISVRSILLWIPLLAIIGMGEMTVMIIRGIDVSVGSIVGLAGLAVGLLFRDAPGIPLAINVVLSVLIGLVLGSINGVLIAWVRVPAVIVTLGTLNVYRGLTFLFTNGSQIDGNYIPKAVDPVVATWAIRHSRCALGRLHRGRQ